VGHSDLLEPIPTAFANNLLRLELPDTTARGGWEFDDTQIVIAMDHLQIWMPVHFRYSAGVYTAGCHRADDDKHRITVTQDRAGLPFPPESPFWIEGDADIMCANEIIWHELAHAAQAEAFTRQTQKPMSRFYRDAYQPARGPQGAAYWDNHFEQQARKIQKMMSPRITLVTTVER
jgi:hypothetical protein